MDKTTVKRFVKMSIPPIMLFLARQTYNYFATEKDDRTKTEKELITAVNKRFPDESVRCSKPGLHHRTYRNMEYIVLEDVVCPSHYSNFKFLEYLMSEVARENDVVLDICAGAGAVGFPLLCEKGVRSVMFVDVSYQAIHSIRETARLNKIQNIQTLLSEGLKSLPTSEKFDVIVANPPMDGHRLTPTLISLAGGDPGFTFHRQFFKEVHNYLKEDGRICFVEDNCFTTPSQFKEMVGSNPCLEFVKSEWLDRRYFIILVTLKEVMKSK